MAQWFGKYRGRVLDTSDPQQMGRLRVTCPQVLGEDEFRWAMPCVPFAGVNEGFYMLPAVDSNVWVEFEAGDPGKPIWSGCFWGSGEVPHSATTPTTRTITSTTATIEITALGSTVAVGPT